MTKQKIKISFTIASDETFRILKVWKTTDALIVLSKLHCPRESFRFACENTQAELELEVEVDKELPVLHYAIGMGENYSKVLLGDYTPQFISREIEIPEPQRAQCLYQNEYSDSQERIDIAFRNNLQFGMVVIRSFDDDSYDDDRLFKRCNEPTTLARLLEQSKHNREEQIIIVRFYSCYHYLISLESKGNLTRAEADEVLSKLYLKREYAEPLKQLHDAYKPGLKEAADKELAETCGKQKKARGETLNEQGVRAFAANSTTNSRVRFLAAPITEPESLSPESLGRIGTFPS